LVIGLLLIFILLFILRFLLRIAFFTLVERFILAIRQLRKAPVKNSFMGGLQAVYDGLKLFSKVILVRGNTIKDLYIFSPLIIFLILWQEIIVIPYDFIFLSFIYRSLYFLSLVGSLVYFIIISGLMRVSKYSLMGAIRSSSQSISYEVIFFFLIFIYVGISYSFILISNDFLIINVFFILIFFITILVELGRAPFDFPESERELVRGVNTELSSSLFVLFFLSEYGFILFFRVLFSFLFFTLNIFWSMFVFILIGFIRVIYPRLKFDYLMGLF